MSKRSGKDRRAKHRAEMTGEKYQLALNHTRGRCGPCIDGNICETCFTEPCWTCRPNCTVRPDGSKCVLDNLQPDGSKRCVYCSGIYPVGWNRNACREVFNTTHWMECASSLEGCPVFPGDTPIDVMTQDVVKKYLQLAKPDPKKFTTREEVIDLVCRPLESETVNYKDIRPQGKPISDKKISSIEILDALNKLNEIRPMCTPAITINPKADVYVKSIPGVMIPNNCEHPKESISLFKPGQLVCELCGKLVVRNDINKRLIDFSIQKLSLETRKKFGLECSHTDACIGCEDGSGYCTTCNTTLPAM